MLLRVLSPSGFLRTVENVLPIIEARTTFNGQKRRIVEVPADGEEPNGLSVWYRDETNRMACRCMKELTIGNLKPEVVREIMRKLLSDGYYDFSLLEFQPRVETVDQTELDNAQGLPYTSDRIECFCETGVFTPVSLNDPFSHTCFSMATIGEDDKDSLFAEDSDEEE